jgi:adenylate cyclase
MAPSNTDSERISQLEERLESLVARQRLNDAADAALEEAMRDRLPLDRAVVLLLPLLCEHAGAASATLETYDEDLRMRRWQHPATSAGSFAISQSLDVAGEDFGQASISFDEELDDAARARAASMLNVWCEQLDNYLAAIGRARHKHVVTSTLSDALMHPVLAKGLAAAIERLRGTVGIDDLVLAYHHEDDRRGETLSFNVIQQGTWCCDSSKPDSSEDSRFMTEHALAFIGGDEDAVLERFGIARPQEQVLINGIKDQRVIGRLVVNSRRGEFNTFDRDLLQRFADYLRQRIVDFNREYKHLALCFPNEIVTRLLAEEGYAERYLSPRERDAAVIFADISGFTRVSEQVLREPALIGKLVDHWSQGVVDIVWDSGGVFDKMVGDCVIAMWGPPLFELSAEEACRRALAAARDIRAYTHTMSGTSVLPELAEVDLGVATGLSYYPLLVGSFGPNSNYTGFSSGMNNTARLQGVACKDEILCSDAFVRAHGDASEFGEERQADVKNVAHPLVFRPAR